MSRRVYANTMSARPVGDSRPEAGRGSFLSPILQKVQSKQVRVPENKDNRGGSDDGSVGGDTGGAWDPGSDMQMGLTPHMQPAEDQVSKQAEPEQSPHPATINEVVADAERREERDRKIREKMNMEALSLTDNINFSKDTGGRGMCD